MPPATTLASSPQTKVLIIDDHELTCMGLYMMLQDKENLVMSGVARCAQDGIEQALCCQPDVVLMDIIMPDMDGITATRLLKKQQPDCRVIMLTSDASPDHVQAAIAAQVNAFCHKDITADDLYHLIRLVARGGMWLDPRIAAPILNAFSNTMGHFQHPHTTLQTASKNNGAQSVSFDLTRREKEVLRLLISGKSNKEIASLMQTTIYTTKAHLNHIYKKLGVSDRTQVAIKVFQEKII